MAAAINNTTGEITGRDLEAHDTYSSATKTPSRDFLGTQDYLHLLSPSTAMHYKLLYPCNGFRFIKYCHAINHIIGLAVALYQ